MNGATLAEVSNTLMLWALVVYVGAFVAFCAEWAIGTRGRLARRAARDAAAQARTPALLGAAAAGSLAAPPPEPGVRKAEAAPASRGAPPRADAAGHIAVALTILGGLLHTAATAARGLATERVPLGNMYEFATGGALAIVAAFLLLLARRRDRSLGVFVLLPVTCVLGLAIAVLYAEAGPLAPALDSYWLGIHVSAAVLCTGAFTIGAVVSALHLAHPRLGATAALRLPGPAALDRLAYRTAAFVFPLWTFAIIAGAIWAENAWGRYWAWDPKETWAFITWVMYAAYLHARSTAGWTGARAAWLNLAGYGCFLFNVVGVNLFLTGLHSYAGL
ncbi:c-type cytochrome biogenesis protein CcsB [Streptomyces sp. 6N223]|uniref:c-type cytochrome biogenesis protein CcsB n=1 Tax=Streptomyces sp. 6N223 TaxID=3457412 RepID=UPI003FD57B04